MGRTPKYICRGRVHYCVAIIEKFYEVRFGFAYKVRIFNQCEVIRLRILTIFFFSKGIDLRIFRTNLVELL